MDEIRPSEFEWDRGNKDKNWLKHKVGFREVEEAFFNRPLKILFDTKHSQKESRFVAFGVSSKGRRLVLVFTVRNQKIRVISARNQSRKERNFYESKTKSNSKI